jgi:hypothetical protein
LVKIVDGAIVILTGVSGETIGDAISTTAGAATAGGETVGTTAGAETAAGQVRVDGGATATFAGGTVDPTIVAAGTVGIMTGAGIIETIDAGHVILAGGETNHGGTLTLSAAAPNVGVNFGDTRSHNRKRRHLHYPAPPCSFDITSNFWILDTL